MYSCGLRRNEVISLDLDDYHVSKEMLVVSGKRRKERTAYLVNEAAIAMMDWIKVRGDRDDLTPKS
jgi:site-specific recombinase XerD